jgi:hypothetical protein
MAADPADPLIAMPWRQRVGLRRRLKRAWREEVARRLARELVHLRVDLSGVPVVSAHSQGTIAEVEWADGTVVRLWLSHRPAVAALGSSAGEGGAVLVRADHHGHCWALYFATPAGRLPVLCRDLRVRAPQGGRPHPQEVAPTGPQPSSAA